MILQCDDRQLRAGLARRRATKVSNYVTGGYDTIPGNRHPLRSAIVSQAIWQMSY